MSGTVRLTDSELSERLRRRSCACPYCDSADLDAGDFGADGPDVWCDVSCDGCARSWREYYRIDRAVALED